MTGFRLIYQNQIALASAVRIVDIYTYIHTYIHMTGFGSYIKIKSRSPARYVWWTYIHTYIHTYDWLQADISKSNRARQRVTYGGHIYIHTYI